MPKSRPVRYSRVVFSVPSPSLASSLSELNSLQTRLLAWFEANGRDLPWRRTRDPYAILVSEVMLQQTQVDRVLPKYLEFLERFPTFQHLGAAGVGDVIRAWSPLGYNQRAVRLHRLAQEVVANHGGELPRDTEVLRRMTGIGPYTAAALEAFAFGRQVPVIDTNVRRVLGRYFEGTEAPAAKSLEMLASAALPQGRAWAWSQALMDLGALACIGRAPRCQLCPVRAGCRAGGEFTAEALSPQRGVEETGGKKIRRVAEGRRDYITTKSPKKSEPFVGSSRYYRGRILAALRGVPTGEALDVAVLATFLYLEGQEGRVAVLVEGLARDGLLRRDGDKVALP